MEFCLKRMNIASFDSCFQKEVLQISKKVEEVIYFKPAFIEKTQEIIVERGIMNLQMMIDQNLNRVLKTT